MPTNIDTGLTVQDAVAADHSPHIVTMSNGDLVVIYYNGTNLVWRSKPSGGSWSAATTITLDTGVTPPQVSYLVRNGNALYAIVSKDPIDATHNGDSFQFAYNTTTHALSTSAKSLDAADGNEKAAGIGFISGATANNQVQMLHGNAAGSFATVQQMNVNPTIVGTDIATTFTDFRSSARSGVLTDGASTTYLIYGMASTGTAFKVERIVTTGTASTVEAPPAPAANLVGIAGVWDGTNFLFIANENNAKLRYLLRTGANTYGSWTDILSDTGLVGQPAVCVKANGDLAVIYQTTKNQANGEIWSVQRTGGTWGSPALVAGGAATGWSNPSVAASDLNDAGVARIVYVTGTASPWTLVEDSLTFGGGSTAVSVSDSLSATDSLASLEADLPLADSLAATESLASLSASFTVADALSASDSVGRTMADAVAATDGVAISASLSQAESVAASDGVAIQASFSLADTTAASDALSGLSVAFTVADTLAAAESLASLSSSFSLAESLTMTDGVTLGTPVQVTEALAASDGLSSIVVSFTLADSLSASDGVASLSSSFSLADALSTSDAVAIQVSFSRSDSLSATDGLASLSASLPVAESLAASDALSSLSSRFSLADTMSLVDLLGGVTTRFALAEAASLADHAQVSQPGVTPSGAAEATFLFLSGMVTFTFPDAVLLHLANDGEAAFTFTG